MDLKKIILTIQEFYDLFYSLNTEEIINKYAIPIKNENFENVREIKEALDDNLDNLVWNMTYPPKDYIEEKVLESLNDIDDHEEYLVVYSYPFFLYDEDNTFPFEFFFSKTNSQLIGLRMF